MEDKVIIDMYLNRSENAISETKIKYGRLICSIAYGILKNEQDTEECENDTYLKVWNTIPPTIPNVFSAFLSKITRNLSLDKYDYLHAEKRGNGEIPLILEELSECIPDQETSEGYDDKIMIQDILNFFLSGLNKNSRIIFMRRYWFGDSIAEISKKLKFGESRVKMSLMRSRQELRDILGKEGYCK